jgi:hypothetical protein
MVLIGAERGDSRTIHPFFYAIYPRYLAVFVTICNFAP